jgi:DNA-binding MarR family transcriptional regulator
MTALPHSGASAAFTDLVLEVFRFNGRLLHAGDRLAEPLNLSSARWQVLGATATSPASVAQISRMMGLTRQAVQRQADILERQKLIRYENNPDHRRAKLVCLTEEGQRVLERITKKQVQWARKIVMGTPALEIERALQLIKKLSDRVDSNK